VKLHMHSQIAAPRAAVWDFVMDVERAARCIDGVEALRVLSAERYEGLLRVRIGPAQLGFEGVVELEERIREQWRGTLRASAKDVKRAGRFEARMALQLEESAPAQTALAVELEVTLFGRLGELGQPLIKKKIGTLLERFAGRVAAELDGTQGSGAVPGPAEGAR